MIDKNLLSESDFEPHRNAYARMLRATYNQDAADLMILNLINQHEKLKEVT